MTKVGDKLKGVRVAVPESRQLDVMAQLLENRGAIVLRAPLVAIHDAPDSQLVLTWVMGFISDPPEWFIILTGEGLRRLLALAERHEIKERFVTALSQVKTLCRGPKPNRVLRELGLSANVQVEDATTTGVINTLNEMNVTQTSIGVQLYGEEPNLILIHYLESKQMVVSVVAPYVYADESETEQVVALLKEVIDGELDVIAFTSQPQFRRLQQVAKRKDMYEAMMKGLADIKIAAVGPLVKQQLESVGLEVEIMPPRAFFMRPLVTEIERAMVQEVKLDV